jgi:hypothetical protein
MMNLGDLVGKNTHSIEVTSFFTQIKHVIAQG